MGNAPIRKINGVNKIAFIVSLTIFAAAASCDGKTGNKTKTKNSPAAAPSAQCLTGEAIDDAIKMQILDFGANLSKFLYLKDFESFALAAGTNLEDKAKMENLAKVFPNIWPKRVPYANGSVFFTAWIRKLEDNPSKVSCKIKKSFESETAALYPFKSSGGKPYGVVGYLFGDENEVVYVVFSAYLDGGRFKLESLAVQDARIGGKDAEFFANGARTASSLLDLEVAAIMYKTTARLIPNNQIVKFAYADYMNELSSKTAPLPTKDTPAKINCGEGVFTLINYDAAIKEKSLYFKAILDSTNMDEPAMRKGMDCVKTYLLSGHKSLSTLFDNIIVESFKPSN